MAIFSLFRIRSLFGGLILLLAACTPEPAARMAMVMTIAGPIPADSLGLTLIHEHVFLDWRGADSIRPEDWQEDSAFLAVLPRLAEVRASGVRTMLECTPSYLGRNPRLLQRLAAASGLQLITNTGYYGAVQDKYLPAHAFTETEDQLANRWIAEFEHGIEGSGVRPGFMKIAVDADSQLSAIDEKLVRAAARAHLRTGMTIVSHTGPDAPALEQARILEAEGLDLSAWVWTHAQGGSSAVHEELAKKGAWISLDGMGWIAPEGSDSAALYRYVEQLRSLRDAGLLHRALISHDAGWYTHGEPGGGPYQPHTPIFTLVMPALRRAGFTETELRQLLADNPAQAYALRVRQ